jgi:hypothetical protein
MRSLLTRISVALLAAAIPTGCVVEYPESSVAHCTRVETADSARAACVALDTVFRTTKRRPIAIEIIENRGGFVVRTAPGDTNRVDGMAQVTVSRELRVIGITWGDSL